MLIDIILDRKDGQEYNPKSMYNYCMGYDYASYQNVARALDSLGEEDVKRALCDYVVSGGYNLEIINYILSVNWLVADNVKVQNDYLLNLNGEIVKVRAWSKHDAYLMARMCGYKGNINGIRLA